MKLLEQVPLFQGCSEKELAHVAKLADEVDFEAGATLVHEGHVGHRFMVLTSGEADVFMAGEQVSSVGPGDVLGEISLLVQTRHTAQVVARGHVHALAVDEENFERMLGELPVVRSRLSSGAFDRLAHEPSDKSAD